MTVPETIHYAILRRIAQQLETDLVTNVPADDPTATGIVVEGPLLDEPDFENARISIQLFENDPFNFDSSWDWVDEPVEEEIEIGGGMTWRRRFTLEARMLLVNTMEDRDAARRIASAIKARVEQSLMDTNFSGIRIGGEYVSAPIFNKNIRSKLLQAGGPESWDFVLHIRFEVKTSKVY